MMDYSVIVCYKVMDYVISVIVCYEVMDYLVV